MFQKQEKAYHVFLFTKDKQHRSWPVLVKTENDDDDDVDDEDNKGPTNNKHSTY